MRLDIVPLSLVCQSSLGLVSVSLSLPILLVGILNRDVFIHDILAVHVRDGGVGGFEIRIRDKSVTLTET